MLSLGWILYLFLISLVIALLTLVILFRKAKSDDSTPASKKVRLIKQLLPSTDQLKGWSLYTVDNGLRVWHKKFDSNTSPWLQGKIFTCSGIIPATQREVMNVLQQAEMSTQWDPEIQQVHNINSRGNKSDVVCVSTNCQGLLAKTVHYVQGLFGGQTSTVYSRYWDVNNKSEAWMFSSFIKEVAPLDGVLWSCFLLSTLDQNDEDEPPECLLTLVIAPVSSSFACIPRLTSSRVAGLQDYFTQSRPSAPLEKPTVSFNANNLLGNSAAPSGIKPEEEINLQGENTVAKESPSLGMIEREGIEELKQKLIGVYQATAGVDGWTLIGNIKDVEILKRSSRTGERPWDCLKGTSIVRVPVHYILAYIFSLDYRGEWDDLFVKGETVEEYDPLTKVNRLEYKPLWPASGRDFCTFVVVRELSEGLYGLASEAVEHEDCPERKGIVRGEIIIGGFVVKELSSDPPSCQVTYMTRVDLKGNLPARIVNRATQSQPQAVAVLRERLEALYKEDVDSQNGKTSKLQQEAVELWVNLMKVKEAKEARVQASGGTPVLSERDDGEAAEEKMSVSECSLTEMSECDSLSLPPDVKEEESQMQPPLADGCLHHLDYKTLANQTIANLVGEILLASKVEISMPEELTYSPRTKDGEWSYQSIEKDVVILRKISQGEKIHSFLGKGIIKVQPPAVWQAVRNHMNRHMYDRMLKKTTLVKQIDDETKILYLHHETTQCFVKQSRDFVVLTADRVEAEKYVIAATSVDIPQLPPSKDIVRGTIYATGWVIEPVLQHGQLFSMVSYLSQVDFGGALPTRLVNLIARRQPLCVSYLRNYLEKLKE